jgi:hypothetical protein
MATPPPHPQLPSIQAFQPLADATFPPPPFPTFDHSMPESPTGGSAMELSHSTMIAPPPPASAFREELLDGAADRRDPPAATAPQTQPEDHEGEDGSGGEDDEEDDDDDVDDEDGDQEGPFRWHPINEDRSLPCDDELKYIESKEEHSAVDHEYWERQTFFELKDPELVPGESGRIEWTVEHFNGTKEKPNKELIMRSPIARIGGYDWQIKFYPRGNRTDYLSVYLENVTMLNDEYKDRAELSSPALPVLAGSPRRTQRNSVAAQVSVVMYNPNEPRVHESKTDAHQYHKKAADFGWKYFTRSGRYDFPCRIHGQRQSILRDDKLAFTAYIRIVNDPTGCMWDTGFPGTEHSIDATGLRPFDTLSAQIAALVPLLHLRPFRDFLYKHKSDSSLFTLLQTCLDKMLSRRLKRKHFKYSTLPEGCDVVNVLQSIGERLRAECHPEVHSEFDELFASFNPCHVPVCDNRLPTKEFSSIREAKKTRASDKTPVVLTMELERQTFNKSKRKWEKLTNSIAIDDYIAHNGVSYSLYAFVKHLGPLGTGNYTPLVRPGGPGSKWYAYESGQVRCQTQKQAMGEDVKRNIPRNGVEYPYHRPLSVDLVNSEATPYLVFYLRNDEYAAYAFGLPAEEQWEIPETVRKPRRALDSSDGAENPNKPAQGPSKSDSPTAEVIDFAPAANGGARPNDDRPPADPDHDTMDGDDIVMSDVEEDGSRTPVHMNAALEGTTNGLTVERREYRDLPEASEATELITVNFFSGEYYRGFALRKSKLYHGEGHLIYTNGDEYKGLFANGLPSGTGTMIYATTGNTYSGDWLEGRHHGQGTYTELVTGNVFEGGFKEGKRSGSFVLRGTVTDEDKGLCQICYCRSMTTAFYECGHVLACKECAAQIENCPVCRKRVLARLELYGVKVSME